MQEVKTKIDKNDLFHTDLTVKPKQIQWFIKNINIIYNINIVKYKNEHLSVLILILFPYQA